MNNSNHYNLPPACENGDRLFRTRDVCCLPYNPNIDKDQQELGKCMPWNRCISDSVNNADDLQICAPSCSKHSQTCPPAPVKDPITGYDLQGVSQCNILNYDWWKGKLPEGTLANCSILSPEMVTGAAYDACKGLTGDARDSCNLCNQHLHFSIRVPSSQYEQGDNLLYITGGDGATARSQHTAEISVHPSFENCMKEPKVATWIRDFVKGPENGGTNPVMRKGTVYEATNSRLSNQLRCVRTPDHPTTPACSAVDCASFNNDAQSSNYCLKKENKDCCRLAILQSRIEGVGPAGGLPGSWSTIGI